MKKILKFAKWILLVLICFLIVLLIIRSFHYFKLRKIENIISKIDSVELNIEDVLGKNLPVEPNEADKTEIGVDSNNNDIRDDVEIAIFKEYSNSEKIRSVLLQYAMTLQMEFTQSFLNKEVAIKIINEQSRADTCLSDTVAPRQNKESGREIKDLEKIENYVNFVREKQFNTDERKKIDDDFYKNLDNNNSPEFFDSLLNTKSNSCDIDSSQLEN